MRALVNKIIPFSMVDGPGSRCSVFLQGCNMSCVYCHNPETQKSCINCGDCVEQCPTAALSWIGEKVVWNPPLCVACDSCIRTCTHFSTPKVREMEAAELFSEVKSYQPFIRGVTVSGGECTLWPEFVQEFFELCQGAGLTTLLDSNGTLDFETHPELMATCDGVMLDVKAWDDTLHRRLTGLSNKQIKKNLLWLSKNKKLEEVRIVVVDGWNDPYTTVEQLAAALKEQCSSTRLKLIAFRNNGVVGELAQASSPRQEEMEKLADYAREQGFKELVIT